MLLITEFASFSDGTEFITEDVDDKVLGKKDAATAERLRTVKESFLVTQLSNCP